MILTFYSYKGGVGRSMAMANIAQAYYLSGKRVILVDWDLEAPGLEGYFHSDIDKLEEFRKKPGLIDMLEDYKQMFSSLHLAIKRSQNEILELPNQIAAIISRDKGDWTAIEQRLNQYALLDDEGIDLIIRECKVAGLKEPITISKIAEILEVKIPDFDLSNKIALELTPRGIFEPAFAQTFLSTYAVLSKDVIKQIIQELQTLVKSNGYTITQVTDIFSEVLAGKAEKIKSAAIESSVDLDRYLQEIYLQPSSGMEFSQSMKILSAGARQGQELLSDYAKKVQNFNWTDFYVSYEGEAYFEQLRVKLESQSDIILVDSRTGISEMSGVSTRQLADKIIIVTAPNPQNLSGASSMVGSFTNERVMAARGNRSLKVYIIPSRVDLSESLYLNKFHSDYLSAIAKIDESIPAQYLWDNGILYIPYYNYNEELAVGVSDRPEELASTGRSPRLDIIYRNLAAFFLTGQLKVEDTNFLPKLSSPHYELSPFEESQASVFFGRNLEVIKLLDKIASGYVFLFGPSGSGKTSLINAGLLAAVRSLPQTHPLADIKVIRYVISHHPMSGLAEAIIRQLEPNKSPGPDLISDLTRELTNASNLNLAIEKSTHQQIGQKYMLILDQFELIHQLSDSEEKEIFAAKLGEWIQNKDLFVLISITGGTEVLTDYSILTMLSTDATFTLSVPGESELRQMIVEPASKSGIKIDARLPERIISDLGQIITGKLLILQSVMKNLWNTRTGPTITHSDYDRIGGTGGALKEYIERIGNTVSESTFNKGKPILTRLAASDKSRSILVNSLTKGERESLIPFASIGLVTIFQEASGNRVALSHDMVASNWLLLSNALAADVAFNEWRKELILRIEAWENKQWPSNLLLKGVELHEAKSMIALHERKLTSFESKFIQTSRVKARKNMIMRVSIAFMVIVITVFIIYRTAITLWNRDAVATKGNTIARDTSRANSLATSYYLSNNQTDVAYNLRVLKELNGLSADQQEKLVRIKRDAETAISGAVDSIIRNFFNDIINQPDRSGSYLADTVDFGKDKHKSRSFITSNIDKRRPSGKYYHTIVDTSLTITTDSSGVTAIFRSSGNITLDRFKSYKSMTSMDTLRFDYDLKVQSYGYKIGTADANPVSVEIFLCITKNEAFKKLTALVISELDKKNGLSVFTKRDFVSAEDPTSAYHITKSQVRYSGNDELRIAREIKKTIESVSPIKITLVRSGTRTPNYLSVFLCEQ